MFCFGILFLFLNMIDSYKVNQTFVKIEGVNKNFIEQPFSVSRVGDNTWILDKNLKLWMINKNNLAKLCGENGQGPGEFNPYLKALIPNSNSITVLHGTGLRIENFSLQSDLISSKKVNKSYLYFDENENSIIIQLNDISALTSFNSISLKITHENQIDHVTLYNEQEEDRINPLNVRVIRGGKFVFIYTRTSIKNQIYYLLVDFKLGEILDLGIKKLIDRRGASIPEYILKDPNHRKTLPVVDGCTFSPELGFVITENTFLMDYRILSIYDPNTQIWNSKKVLDGGAGFFYQHMEKDIWGAFFGNSWDIIKLTKIP